MSPSNKKGLASNTAALLSLQLANYILPLLVTPYLTRTLGISIYGVVAFGLAISQIACIITDYGFNLSATYQIAKESDNKEQIRKICGAVFTCKVILLIPVLFLLSAFIHFSTNYNEYHDYFWLLLLPIIGQTFQPTWLFQGIEKMAYMTIFTVTSRICVLGLTIIFVAGPQDYSFVAITTGLANIFAALIGIAFMLKLGYSPSWSSWSFTRKIFDESTEFFWSRAALASYTAGTTFFLGIFSTPVQVAYYAAAEQLYKGAQSFITPLTQALYPYMARNKDVSLFAKILKYTVLLSILGCVAGVLIGKQVLALIFGHSFIDAYPTLILFMLLFLITTPSVLLGYPFLGALGDTKTANRSVIYAGLVQITLLLICYLLELKLAVQVLATTLIAEAFVLTFRGYKAVQIGKQLSNPGESDSPALAK
ncbi:oligosaccharide flippase family protein [Pseudomonas delhiensis]|uniref:oligosaccharide flippase family protein n=1 Tax=Pseudomonas delhiensis TaxID=366289 RepID=UPI00315A5BF4